MVPPTVNYVCQYTHACGAPKCPNLSDKSNLRKTFEGDMFSRSHPTTLLQLFCKEKSHSKAFLISITEPDDTVLCEL